MEEAWERRGTAPADLLREPWDRWRAELSERAAAVEESRRHREAFLSSEKLRKTVQALYLRYGGINTYDEHLRPLAHGDRAALELLLHETRAMTGLERRAWGFFARRTTLDELGRPHAIDEEIPMSPEQREAVSSLHDALFARQREFVASLHARYPYLPWVVRAIRELGAGRPLHHRTWWERHGRTKNDLAELQRLYGRNLDYLKRREREISEQRRGANIFARHTSLSELKVGRAIDEEQLRACPDCEQLVVPSRDDHRYHGYCPFCGGRDKLLSITDAEATGLVERDGEGFWRAGHGPVPGWVESQPLPPLDQDDGTSQEDEG